MFIHKDSHVSAAIDLFDDLLADKNKCSTSDYLTVLAKRLIEGHRNRHTGITFITGRFFKKPTLTECFESTFTLENAQWCIAQEHGYQDWEAVIAQDDQPNTAFEDLIDAMLAGDLKTLQNTLQNKPEWVHHLSHYPHKATLLHYTGSNGIEGYRQVVPKNLADIIECLLNAGANVWLKANLYGGCTARELLETSKHPYEAGVITQAQAVYNRLASAPKA